MEANDKLVQLHWNCIKGYTPNAKEHALLTTDVAVKFADFLGEQYESWWEDDTWIEKEDRMIDKIREGRAKFHTTAELFDYFITNVYQPNING